MLRLTLTDADVVLVVAPVDADREGTPVAPGSTVVRCEECDCACWRSPQRPLMRAVDGGFVSTTRGMVCDPTVLLCISCAGMHWELATGKRLGL